MTVTAYTLAAVLGLFVLFIGARFLLQPRAAAEGYGVPAGGMPPVMLMTRAGPEAVRAGISQ
ncbi:hypothetical protein [Streptomyces ambofaciens]|uniref:Putative membrane protein n=1 Tax=Streptomyces ambofaciens (strain ATCC 23877 / 3486 / DSM 40053 / JCM 4204 / NBRC 12836 / NRRL B-2516) TaxID=278992 RepID=A0ADB5_STRA7|nr:hypothetical protein [Streptomyces ambofaciens]CAJ88471.1 putative membrane protein [Streptomyces ambofaciens ATCC 23877]